MGSGFAGTGGFVLRVLDGADPVTEYVPGHTYTVEISNSVGYAGFLLQSVRGVPGSPDVDGVGTFSFENLSLYQQNGLCTNPASSVTHTLTRPPQQLLVDRFNWLAPAAGTGSVTFHLVGVVSRFVWYGGGAAITLTLLEGVSAVDSWSWGAVRSLYR
jgi:hypothetical protein